MAVLLAGWPTAAGAMEVKSPNGRLSIVIDVQEFAGAKGCPVYRVVYHGKPLVVESRLGLEIDGRPLNEGLAVVRQTLSTHDSTWKPVYGERNSIRDHYQQLVVELQETASPHRLLQLTLRAYDEGVAFCYTLPKQAGLDRALIGKELTEFRFPADHTAWAVYSAQGKYAQVALSQMKPGCERPLTMQAAEDRLLALAEARLVDYARMKFAPLAGHPHCLTSVLGSPVSAELPLTTPWRVVMAADTPGQLLENNTIILNLNDPCAIADTSWIKPGKVIREVTLTTVGGKACVDFAARHKLQYVEFDAGWYGPEGSRNSDATGVHVDPARSSGPLDLQEVIGYAAGRGVGIILYVNHLALERQLDDLLPLYQKWGVKGIKFGFVNVGTQQWTAWLHEAIRKAAQYQLMVDVHDEYRPTGYSRTYPNLLTQEGIAGDETSPVNTLTLTILFTRMLAGPADNTVCYYDARVDRNATHAYQLAKPVCLYSPFQFLFWYDRPPGSPSKKGGAGNAHGTTGDEPELEFYEHLPTVWDDTRVIGGKIGEYALVARRSGPCWYLGGMNSGQERALDVPLDFLEKGKSYVAHVYRDDPTVATRTHVKIERLPVDAGTVLKVTMSAQGGQAIRIVPAAETQ